MRSPSCRRAQQLMRQAIAQPVVMSPRLLSETRAAAASSGVPRGVICALGALLGTDLAKAFADPAIPEIPP